MFTDIHSHILPGIDDGARDWNESLTMLQQARDEGISTVVATPHYGLYNQLFDIAKARILTMELNKKVAYYNIDVKVLLGNELYYVPGIVDGIINGTAATIADTSYVLIEFSEGVLPDTVENAVQEFTSLGYKPILAHVERYSELYDKKLETINYLRDQGAYFQINARSIVGRKNSGLFSKKDDRVIRTNQLLKADKVDFVATDAHNTSGRAPFLTDAINKLNNLVGKETADRILYTNPQLLLENEFISL